MVVDNSEYKHRFVNYKLFLFKDAVGNTGHCATRAINGHFLDAKNSELLSFPQNYISIDLGPVQTSNFSCAESNANERKQ